MEQYMGVSRSNPGHWSGCPIRRLALDRKSAVGGTGGATYMFTEIRRTRHALRPSLYIISGPAYRWNPKHNTFNKWWTLWTRNVYRLPFGFYQVRPKSAEFKKMGPQTRNPFTLHFIAFRAQYMERTVSNFADPKSPYTPFYCFSLYTGSLRSWNFYMPCLVIFRLRWSEPNGNDGIIHMGCWWAGPMDGWDLVVVSLSAGTKVRHMKSPKPGGPEMVYRPLLFEIGSSLSALHHSVNHYIAQPPTTISRWREGTSLWKGSILLIIWNCPLPIAISHRRGIKWYFIASEHAI